MVWNWPVNAKQSIDVGGRQGSVAEAGTVETWPNYEAAYLAKRLGSEEPQQAYANRYKHGLNPDAWEDQTARQVYLDKVASDFRTEADECLKAEFIDWLQGTHEANESNETYPNQPGQAPRRAVFKTRDGNKVAEAGEQLNNWKPTWWGKNQLTHLDGVRDFLREKKVNAEEHEFAMNVLAEFGPNNIDQAWTYFKHWVKGRPVKPEECIHTPVLDSDGSIPADVERSTPMHMAESRSHILNGTPSGGSSGGSSGGYSYRRPRFTPYTGPASGAKTVADLAREAHVAEKKATDAATKHAEYVGEAVAMETEVMEGSSSAADQFGFTNGSVQQQAELARAKANVARANDETARRNADLMAAKAHSEALRLQRAREEDMRTNVQFLDQQAYVAAWQAQNKQLQNRERLAKGHAPPLRKVVGNIVEAGKAENLPDRGFFNERTVGDAVMMPIAAAASMTVEALEQVIRPITLPNLQLTSELEDSVIPHGPGGVNIAGPQIEPYSTAYALSLEPESMDAEQLKAQNKRRVDYDGTRLAKRSGKLGREYQLPQLTAQQESAISNWLATVPSQPASTALATLPRAVRNDVTSTINDATVAMLQMTEAAGAGAAMELTTGMMQMAANIATEAGSSGAADVSEGVQSTGRRQRSDKVFTQQAIDWLVKQGKFSITFEGLTGSVAGPTNTTGPPQILRIKDKSATTTQTAKLNATIHRAHHTADYKALAAETIRLMRSVNNLLEPTSGADAASVKNGCDRIRKLMIKVRKADQQDKDPKLKLLAADLGGLVQACKADVRIRRMQQAAAAAAT